MWWFVASFFSGRYTWGFGLLKYYSLIFRMVWFLSGLAMMSLLQFIPEPKYFKFSLPKSESILIVLLPAGLVLYILLRVNIPLLGDGFLRSQEISAGRLLSFTEPLTTLAHGMLYRLLSVLNFQTNLSQLSYRILSAVGGTAALTLYYFYAKDHGDRQVFWPLIFILAGAGFNQIFYGYIESYALFLAVLGWYLFLARKNISDSKPSFIPAILAGLAVALHGSGIFLISSLIYYWNKKSYFSVKTRVKRFLLEFLSFSAIPVAALVIGLLLASRPEVTTSVAELPKKSMLPLWGGFWGYGIFSPGHWLDIFNQLLLAAPVAWLLFWANPRAGYFKEPAEKFLGLAVAGGILFLIVVDPKLGTARDWDLLSWPFMALLFFILHRVLKLNLEWRRWAAAAVISVWLFLPWIMVNVSAEKSLARYTDLLAADKRSAAYGYENLAIYYRDHRDPEMMERAYRMARDSDSLNPRHIYNYALALSQNGNDLRSLPYFQKSLQLEARSAKRWNDYGAALIKCQMPEPAREALSRALALDQGNGDALYNMGVAHCLMLDWTMADSFFALTNRTGYPDAWLYYYWGEVKLNLKQYPKAAEYLKIAIDVGIREKALFDAYQKALAALPERNR